MPRMSDSLECPNCHRSVERGDAPGGRRDPRCPGCGFRLIVAGGPQEAEVRRHLYGRRLAVVRISGAGGEGDEGSD